ncbi:hypothetical protein M231_07365 [Tremella mesenterica]|uniref:RING-type domain-containing protein n=1 Tax=Tremella mesenterica TaxID=5217 RepID=A0A4Q1BEA2_TREME|nr:hypothetical protein M231_07365 [Tremella mesenterica]
MRREIDVPSSPLSSEPFEDVSSLTRSNISDRSPGLESTCMDLPDYTDCADLSEDVRQRQQREEEKEREGERIEDEKTEMVPPTFLIDISPFEDDKDVNVPMTLSFVLDSFFDDLDTLDQKVYDSDYSSSSLNSPVESNYASAQISSHIPPISATFSSFERSHSSNFRETHRRRSSPAIMFLPQGHQVEPFQVQVNAKKLHRAASVDSKRSTLSKRLSFFSTVSTDKEEGGIVVKNGLERRWSFMMRKREKSKDKEDKSDRERERDTRVDDQNKHQTPFDDNIILSQPQPSIITQKEMERHRYYPSDVPLSSPSSPDPNAGHVDSLAVAGVRVSAFGLSDMERSVPVVGEGGVGVGAGGVQVPSVEMGYDRALENSSSWFEIFTPTPPPPTQQQQRQDILVDSSPTLPPHTPSESHIHTLSLSPTNPNVSSFPLPFCPPPVKDTQPPYCPSHTYDVRPSVLKHQRGLKKQQQQAPDDVFPISLFSSRTLIDKSDIPDFATSPSPLPLALSDRDHVVEQDKDNPIVSMSFPLESGGDLIPNDTRPPLQHPFHHKPTPSVPFSTRTTSTLSDPSIPTSRNPSSDVASPPSTLSNFSNFSLRRHSRFTAISSSSSSLYSDTSSVRLHDKYPSALERPDISTVYEEVDVEFSPTDREFSPISDNDPRYPDPSPEQTYLQGREREVIERGNREGGEKRERIQRDQLDFDNDPSQRGSINYHTTSQITLPADQSHSHSHSQIHSSSSSTLIPLNINLYNQVKSRSNRTGTISSTHSTYSGNSNKLKSKPHIHPFANVVLRPSTPSNEKRVDVTLIGSNLSNSRSQPNLAEGYRNQGITMAQRVVSSEEVDEETCPVCVESLSFTFRLPGEKAPIVPECGHSLHHECFVTVYGDVPPEGSKKVLGVCGVCRQPMRIADKEDRKARGKLALLMGQGGAKPSIPHSHSTPSIRSGSGRGPLSPHGPRDANSDDPLEAPSRAANADSKVVVPSISIRSEYPSITRNPSRKGAQAITAMITVEVPPAGERGRYQGRPRLDMVRGGSNESQLSPQLPPSPRSASSHPADMAPTSARSVTSAATPSSFGHVINDLKNRVQDYRTSGLDTLGTLRLFDLLYVRKGPLIREFHVYLFQDALICVSEERKSGLKSLFSSSSSVRSNDTGASGRGVLKLKGRIYMKHVRKILDSSTSNELSLTITMMDESMDSFILVFKDRGSHETWKGNLNRLLEEVRPTNSAGNSASKVSKLMGNGAPLPQSSNPRSPSTNSSGGLGMSFGDLTSPSVGSYANTPATSNFSPSSKTEQSIDLTSIPPLAPVHTPLDLVIIISLPSPTSSATPLKVKLMRQSLSFICALLGSRDRLSLVACEMGSNGTVRKTPFLNPTYSESRRRLNGFIELLGNGKIDEDEYEAVIGGEERQDVVTAVNVALDVVLQRKTKNPITGMILISDTSDIIKRAQMDLVAARLDAANVPVHSLGYGKSHDPSPLWMISNHTNGTYTFVKEWYDLRDTLAGIIGGLMSVAITNMKLHLNCTENDFKVVKVSGAIQAIVGTSGKEVDVELKELRFGEIREILVELDLIDSGSPRSSGEEYEEGGIYGDGGGGMKKKISFSGRSGSISTNSNYQHNPNSIPTGLPHGQNPSSNPYPMSGTSNNGISNSHGINGIPNPHVGIGHGSGISTIGLGIDTLSVSESNALRENMYSEEMIDEVPVVEVDCSFSDPAVGRSVARLTHPILLTLALVPFRGTNFSTNFQPTSSNGHSTTTFSPGHNNGSLHGTSINGSINGNSITDTGKSVQVSPTGNSNINGSSNIIGNSNSIGNGNVNVNGGGNVNGSGGGNGSGIGGNGNPDPMIVRRRMELLTSDMITRALLIASRKNFSHASRILKETRRIVETVQEGLSVSQNRLSPSSSGMGRDHMSPSIGISGPGGGVGGGRGNYRGEGIGGYGSGNSTKSHSKKEIQIILATKGLDAIISDLDMLLDGLEEHKEMFERDHRNYAAQQAVVLRGQKSWTTRTSSERQYCTAEVQQIVQLSGEWAGRP